MASLTITVDANLRAMARLADRLGNLKPAVGQIAAFGLRHSRDRLRERIEHPARSIGNLARSGHSAIQGEATAYVGYASIYARIQAEGGIVTPRGHPYLAIPIPDWLAKSGTWPREFPRGSLVFAKRVQISLLGSTWFGPALVKATKSIAAQKEWMRAEAKERHKRANAKERRALGFVRTSTKESQAAELQLIARGAKAARKDEGRAGDVDAGEVMYALVRSVRIPADPWLAWDETWAKFSSETLSKHLGFTA